MNYNTGGNYKYTVIQNYGNGGNNKKNKNKARVERMVTKVKGHPYLYIYMYYILLPSIFGITYMYIKIFVHFILLMYVLEVKSTTD